MDTENREQKLNVIGGIEKKWYDIGFIFAINFLNSWISEMGDKDFDDKFKDLVEKRIGEDVINDKYFEDFHFYIGDSGYGGQCPDPEHPGDPTHCIPCTRSRMGIGVPKPPRK